jgi:Cytochrome c554 and c-prime
MITISIGYSRVGAAEPLDASRLVGSQSCMTSGCHGGAGLDRGAYTIWKGYDPHFNSAATLTNGRSKAMARQLGIENVAESKSCTICHSPMAQVFRPALASVPEGHGIDSGVSCASCHGHADKWLLSHTRTDYPKDALAALGMRPLGTAYQRANSCVACHQSLSEQLVEAKHPPLVFELDGQLVAEPKHWREDKGFSHVQTWLVGQAVALRETAAQAKREPGERRTAEIEAIRALLNAAGAGWQDTGKELVRAADDYAKQISSSQMSHDQGRAILSKLASSRAAFQADAFSSVAVDYRWWAVGDYAERLTLSIDRLNQSLIMPDKPALIAKSSLDALFNAARPAESFDAATADEFVQKLDQVAKSLLAADP